MNKKNNKERKLYDFDLDGKNQKDTNKIKKINNKKENNKRRKNSNLNNEIFIGIESPKQEIKDKKKTIKKVSNKKAVKKKKRNIKTNINKENKQKINYYDDNNYVKPKKSFKSLKLFLVLVLFIGLIVFAMVSPIFNLKKIKVIGNDLVSEEAIIELSNLNYGTNIFRISKRTISKNIKKNGYIDSISIKRSIPDTIKIIVKERKPTFIIQKGNAFLYLNNQGYILEESLNDSNIPKIIGTTTNTDDLTVGKRLNNSDLEKLDVVLKIINEAEQNGLKEIITSVNISNIKDYTININGDQKIVHLGDASNISARMNNLKIILNKTQDQRGEIFIDMDLNFKNPYFREYYVEYSEEE